MKKPTIKILTKHWVSTLAVSGLLVMGACGSEENTTVQEDFAATEEVVVPERENVAVVEEEVVVAEEEVVETEAVAPVRSDRFAYTIQNMDAHLEKFEDVNQAIVNELTDANNQVAIEIE